MKAQDIADALALAKIFYAYGDEDPEPALLASLIEWRDSALGTVEAVPEPVAAQPDPEPEPEPEPVAPPVKKAPAKKAPAKAAPKPTPDPSDDDADF